MANLVNTMAVREIAHGLKDASGMLVCSVGGLNVVETEELRDQLAEQGVRLRFVRSGLAARACAERGLEFPDEVFAGSVAIVTGSDEQALAAAKVLKASPLSKSGRLGLRGGMLEGAALGAREAAALADVPDRKTLQAKLLGCLSGPARSLVSVLNANPSGVARVLQARADSQGPAAG